MNRSQVYVVLATVGFSFILIFTTVLKRLGMSSFEQLFFRLVFSLFILFSWLIYRRKLRITGKKRVHFFGAIGLTYAFFALCGLSAIAFDVPIAVSVALVYTQPMFTALISFSTKKEKPTLSNTSVIVLGVIGAFLVSGLNPTDPQINIGIVFPILAGFLYAVYLWLKRRAPRDEYTPLQILFNTYLLAIPVLLAAWMIFLPFSARTLLVGVIVPDAMQLLSLFLFAMLSTVLPYGLLNYVKVEEFSPTT